MEELLQCKAAHPDARIMGGNTEVGIEMHIKGAAYPVLIDATHVPELQMLQESGASCLLVCGSSSAAHVMLQVVGAVAAPPLHPWVLP